MTRKTGQPISVRQRSGDVGVAGADHIGLVDRAVDGQRVLDHPGAEPPVGDVDVVVRPGMHRDGEVDRRQLDRLDPAGPARLADRAEHRQHPGALGEQLVGVAAAGWAGAFGRRVRGVQVGHRGRVPREDVREGDPAGDGGDGPRRHRAQLDLDLSGVGSEQLAQRGDRGPGAVELLLQAPEVARDQLGAPLRIVGGEDRLDLGQRHVQLAEPVDDLRGRDLLARVVAVAGELVDARRLEQAGLVIAAQRTHAQVGECGELADRQSWAHWPILLPLPGGRSTT